MPRKSTQLKSMLQSKQIQFLLEAHNGLSAKIVEEAGFKGIWASGLSISATLGVRDSNEASWTQVLDAVEFMSDASSIPILLDGDTGYGNFNNVRRLIRKLEQREIAGVCLEDKLFPKTNSFLHGEQQALADRDEFAGKIRAAKDTQRDADFCIIARIESLISGWGMAETLDRAHAYHEAGADGLLIHSKRSAADEILEFMRLWGNTCPVVIVPTMYYRTPVSVFEEAGVSLVIWANHVLRSAIAAMKWAAAQIHDARSLLPVEEHIATVREIFRLQNVAELEAAELRYLPRKAPAQGAERKLVAVKAAA